MIDLRHKGFQQTQGHSSGVLKKYSEYEMSDNDERLCILRSDMSGKGKCEKHGEVSVWIGCRHVGDGSADIVIFSENQDALCLVFTLNV